MAVCLAAPKGFTNREEDEEGQVTTESSSTTDMDNLLEPEGREIDEPVSELVADKETDKITKVSEDNPADSVQATNKHSTIIPVYALPDSAPSQVTAPPPHYHHYYISYFYPNNYGYVPYTPYYAYTSQYFAPKFFAYSSHHF